MHLEALLRADSIALAPRKTVAPDRGAPDVLDDVLPGAPQARASANDNAARGSERLTPFLERLSRATTALERRAEELRAKLSPATAQLLDTLAKRHVSPPIATLGDSACGQCNVRVPTALANAIISDSTMHRCPHCKRILVRAASNELPSASP
jgi:predicted  nucleic acid-binding Zn-ribbon protein